MIKSIKTVIELILDLQCIRYLLLKKLLGGVKMILRLMLVVGLEESCKLLSPFVKEIHGIYFRGSS